MFIKYMLQDLLNLVKQILSAMVSQWVLVWRDWGPKYEISILLTVSRVEGACSMTQSDGGCMGGGGSYVP